MREIVLDTETTGLDPRKGDRIVEIGCVELHHCIPTGRVFQAYINPQCPMSEGAMRVSGLTDDFLKDFPLFHHVVDKWLNFIDSSPLIIHNAPFDLRFLNAELEKIQYPILSSDRVTCTLEMTRRLFPGSPASLDALCKRFGIDNTHREKHGALLDSELLSEVYLCLKGGRQVHLSFASAQCDDPIRRNADTTAIKKPLSRPYPWIHQPSPEEYTAHKTLLHSVKNPLWDTI